MDIRSTIAATLTEVSKSNAVIDAVVDQFVTREVNKRSTAIVTILDLLSREKQNSYKLKPDIETFDADGKVVSSGFSKTKAEEIKKNKELISKYENALTKALDKDDYSDVYNLANSGKS